jgi:hypothetical protein
MPAAFPYSPQYIRLLPVWAPKYPLTFAKLKASGPKRAYPPYAQGNAGKYLAEEELLQVFFGALDDRLEELLVAGSLAETVQD